MKKLVQASGEHLPVMSIDSEIETTRVTDVQTAILAPHGGLVCTTVGTPEKGFLCTRVEFVLAHIVRPMVAVHFEVQATCVALEGEKKRGQRRHQSERGGHADTSDQ